MLRMSSQTAAKKKKIMVISSAGIRLLGMWIGVASLAHSKNIDNTIVIIELFKG